MKDLIFSWPSSQDIFFSQLTENVQIRGDMRGEMPVKTDIALNENSRLFQLAMNRNSQMPHKSRYVKKFGECIISIILKGAY